MVRRAAALVAAAVVAAASTPLGAHDFWIEPSTFHPSPGSVVSISLRVGQKFIGDAVPRAGDRFDRFVLRQDGRDQEIGGTEGIDPAGFVQAGRAAGVVAYRSKATFIEMPAAKFEAYLRDEGLERIVAERHAGGLGERPGREYFSRYAKAVISGERGSPAVTSSLGLELELVPDRDPSTMQGPFRGHLLYQGRPIAGVRVVAMLRSNPSAALVTRTDAAGAFSLTLRERGVWLVKAVHMVKAGWFSRADWQSLWASLTFEAP